MSPLFTWYYVIHLKMPQITSTLILTQGNHLLNVMTKSTAVLIKWSNMSNNAKPSIIYALVCAEKFIFTLD